jgi:hypothetical protein
MSGVPQLCAVRAVEMKERWNRIQSAPPGRKGDSQWRLIAVRRYNCPFCDEAALAVPGTPEVREYMAIGIVNDEEVGQQSEIKEVVYAG